MAYRHQTTRQENSELSMFLWGSTAVVENLHATMAPGSTLRGTEAEAREATLPTGATLTGNGATSSSSNAHVTKSPDY